MGNILWEAKKTAKLPDPFSTNLPEKQIQTTREIIDAIFKDPQVKY
ncbi:hypothetical protein GW782_00770, partial [bacterium]|nr:hypothetical protein [archaeon]